MALLLKCLFGTLSACVGMVGGMALCYALVNPPNTPGLPFQFVAFSLALLYLCFGGLLAVLRRSGSW
jgi:hypothetical protein